MSSWWRRDVQTAVYHTSVGLQCQWLHSHLTWLLLAVIVRLTMFCYQTVSIRHLAMINTKCSILLSLAGQILSDHTRHWVADTSLMSSFVRVWSVRCVRWDEAWLSLSQGHFSPWSIKLFSHFLWRKWLPSITGWGPDCVPEMDADSAGWAVVGSRSTRPSTVAAPSRQPPSVWCRQSEVQLLHESQWQVSHLSHQWQWSAAECPPVLPVHTALPVPANL